jgi:hypothetical protein
MGDIVNPGAKKKLFLFDISVLLLLSTGYGRLPDFDVDHRSRGTGRGGDLFSSG